MRLIVLSILFFSIVSCGASLDGKQVDTGFLVGTWQAIKGKNQLNQTEFYDMHLEEGGKGFYGAGLVVEGKEQYLPFLSYTITSWQLRNDTLMIEGKVDASKAKIDTNIQVELAGMDMSKQFVVMDHEDSWFKVRMLQPPGGIISISSEASAPNGLKFEKK